LESASLDGRDDVVQSQSWVTVAVYSDRMSAEAVLELLAGAALPAYVSSNDHVPGLGTSFAIFVPSDLLHRARWILQDSEVSDRELTYLATRELTETGES
jgi:hypothetical protein